MKGRSLFWHIFPCFLGVALLSNAAVVAFAGWSVQRLQRKVTREELRNRAVLLAPQVSAVLHDSAALQRLVVTSGRATGTRFTVVLPDGKVMADSDEDPALMDNHGDRPEIMEASAGDTGVALRFSSTLRRQLLYVAVPLDGGTGNTAILRAATPLQSIVETGWAFTEVLGVVGTVVFAVVVLLSLLISRRLSTPIEDLTRGAERFASGDFTCPLSLRGSAETTRLAVAMNAMAEQLDERIRAIVRKSNEQDAVLSAMVEGVLAVDTEERILGINEAGSRMLGIDAATATGRYVQEVIRNAAVQRFVTQLLEKRTFLSREITLGGTGDQRVVEAHGTVLRGSRGGVNGVLVVMHDVTRLKKLENLRRDFVANVSHELRTPLTSIKGFLETLQEGAANDPAERDRFLGIISHHVDRLNRLIEDLLTLSRLEKDETEGGVELELCELDGVVRSAIELCADRAASRGVRLMFVGEFGVQARINQSLIEQALVNLLDNAVKYGAEDSVVEIRVTQNSEGVAITVSDQGPGIAPEHLPRLFERFYRVDKARSSKLGGTGLGLAIVKHIMSVHAGSVSVESSVGKGSTFTLHLPPCGQGKRQ